jgi:hypothetical protein
VLGIHEESRRAMRDMAMFTLHSQWPPGPPQW